jgi:hypothetical protein
VVLTAWSSKSEMTTRPMREMLGTWQRGEVALRQALGRLHARYLLSPHRSAIDTIIDLRLRPRAIRGSPLMRSSSISLVLSCGLLV